MAGANDLPLDFRIRGLEQRPLVGDPQAYVRHLVDSGFNVSTIGAMNGLGYAAYRTEHLPAVDGMDPRWIPGVLAEAHKHGIKLICWNVFNIQDVRDVNDFQIAKRYPQWQMEYIDVPGVDYGPRTGMCVLSSPYLEHHARLIQEVASLGVDAMWFDGFYLGGIPHPIRPGCVCSHCRDRFRSDYGMDIPRRVDWTDPTFKRWVRWRNERLMAGARFITGKIHEVRPGIPVTMNYNQWPFGTKDWPNGIPLWRTGDYGVSQHAYSPDERMQWLMLGYKAQLSHDLNPDYSDVWRTGRPIFDLDESRPADVARHELQIRLFTLAALTFGTIPWRSHHQFAEVQRRNNDVLAAREPWFRKERIAGVGVVLSQNSHDFWGHSPGTANLTTYRESILGTWLLLTERHVPFSFVFDNELTRVGLTRFHTLILPNTACLSDHQIHEIEAWAHDGGELITTGEAGRFDEWGDPRKAPVLGDREGGRRFEADPGRAYAADRGEPAARALAEMLRARLPYVVDAPEHVVANLFRDRGADGADTGRLVFQLLNASAFYGFGNGCGYAGGGGGSAADGRETASDAELTAHAPERITPFVTRPVERIRIAMAGQRVSRAESAVTGERFEIENGNTIVVPRLEDHDTIIVTAAGA